MKILPLAACAAAALCAAGSSQAAPKDDRHFLMDAIKGDNSETTLGRLAERRGASRGVKDFGHMLAMDHSEGRRQAAGLARKMGWSVPDAMMPEAKHEYRKLQSMHGRAFDREFAAYMVDDHTKDIAEFSEQASGEGPVAGLARDTLPVLRKHLQTAQSLQGA